MALPGFASEAAKKRHQMVKAVFLDRDGVINANLERNGKPVAPTTLADFRIFPGAAEAARRLKDAGFLLIVVTNQPDVRTGLTPKATMEAMHAEIPRQMPIDDFMICFHTDADNCSCRKPKPGLMLRSRRQVRYRSGFELHRGRSLARRIGRPGGRLPARSWSITALNMNGRRYQTKV